MNENKDLELYNAIGTEEENQKNTKEIPPPAEDDDDSSFMRALDAMQEAALALMEFLAFPAFFTMPFCGLVWKELFSEENLIRYSGNAIPNPDGIGAGYFGLALTLLFPIFAINEIFKRIMKRMDARKNCNTPVLDFFYLLFNVSVPIIAFIVQKNFFEPTNASSKSMVFVNWVFTLPIMFPICSLYYVVSRKREKAETTAQQDSSQLL